AGSFDTLSNQNLPFNSHFYLQKINQNGDSLWSRSINMVNGEGKQNLLNGLDLTNDQGFVLTGWFFGTLDSLDKRFCIAKLDEWGCDTVDCQLTGINENISSSGIFTLLQNPINNELEIILKDSKIDYNYKIIDLKGASIKSGLINSTIITIDISDINSGIYFLQVGNKRKLQTEKIVVIKN
ncbi:MAG: T9SS type A sorting domain-containing protein, partial [Bacteroidia bacterium]|nr:T9SS type A sorting domain-containing protein [Bacteroidia bacterium]